MDRCDWKRCLNSVSALLSSSVKASSRSMKSASIGLISVTGFFNGSYGELSGREERMTLGNESEPVEGRVVYSLRD